MKTTLVILIAGIFLMITPMLAAAHGSDRHNGGSKQHKSWVNDRHGSDHYRQDREHKFERKANKHIKQQVRARKLERKAKKHFKQHLREHRFERRHMARHYGHYNRRPYYAGSAYYYGLPNIFFRFNW